MPDDAGVGAGVAPTPIRVLELSGPEGVVRIAQLDVAAARTQVTAAVQRMASRHPEIERVVLFGSLARGDAVPGSDADLLVMLSESDLPFLDRILRYTPADAGIAVDVFPYTRPELDDKLAALTRWAADIAAGITLYQRARSIPAAARSVSGSVSRNRD